MPTAASAPQARQPSTMPSAARHAARRPSTVDVRRTSAVSRPGVTVRTAAAAVNAPSEVKASMANPPAGLTHGPSPRMLPHHGLALLLPRLAGHGAVARRHGPAR